MAYDPQAESFGLPLYQSHKRVKAAKISTIYSEGCVGLEPDGRSFTFDPAGRPTPQIGWYAVCYEEGYVSFSPPEAFENGYGRVEA